MYGHPTDINVTDKHIPMNNGSLSKLISMYLKWMTVFCFGFEISDDFMFDRSINHRTFEFSRTVFLAASVQIHHRIPIGRLRALAKSYFY